MVDHQKSKAVKPTTFSFGANGRIPNSQLPVAIYKSAGEGEDLAKFFKHRFKNNHWRGQWAQGIYGYHHFHSNAHEVLGIAAGSALLILGGEGGREIAVDKGDVLVLPAGTGHRRIKDSWDFWVVGAYPQGQENYDEYTDQAMCMNCKNRLRAVELPTRDPLYGEDGPLVKLWTKVRNSHPA